MSKISEAFSRALQLLQRRAGERLMESLEQVQSMRRVVALDGLADAGDLSRAEATGSLTVAVAPLRESGFEVMLQVRRLGDDGKRTTRRALYRQEALRVEQGYRFSVSTLRDYNVQVVLVERLASSYAGESPLTRVLVGSRSVGGRGEGMRVVSKAIAREALSVAIPVGGSIEVIAGGQGPVAFEEGGAE